jgi:hypothetical protein
MYFNFFNLIIAYLIFAYKYITFERLISMMYQLLVVFIFIVLVYFAMQNEHPEFSITLLFLAGAALLWYNGSLAQEHLFMPAGTKVRGDVVTDDGELNIDTDDHSKYGNIIESSDIDMMDQRLHGLDLSDPAGREQRIDNSDVVEMALNKGNAVFQPNGVGVSATNSVDLASFTLHEPGVMSAYDLPQSNFMDLDEVLSRKQQHRANMNKKATDGHVRSTKNIYNKYFKNELDENEKRVWYSAEAQEFDTDFDPSL